MFNDENIEHTNDMATVVSAGVNGWSAKLYHDIDKDPWEAVRSTFLGILDILSLAEDSEFVKNISKNQANSIIQTIVLGHRFLESSFSLEKQADENNGFIKTATILDLFADGSAIFSNIVDYFKISPMGIVLNATSIVLTTISNKMKELDLKPEVHIDEIAQIIQMAIKASMSPAGIALEAITELAETLTPEEYKFWSDKAVELAGTNGNDTFESLSTYFHDRPRIIFANGGNDTLNGDDGNDYLDGGSDHDTFLGDEGNDTYADQEGFDAYHIKGIDKIYDSDGKGQIIFDGKALPKEFIKPKDFNEIWEAKDSTGKVIYTAVRVLNDLVISSENSPTDRVTIKDFFLTAKTSGTTYSALSIVLGDSKEEINKEGIYTIKTDDKLHSNVCTKGFSKTQANDLHYQYIA